MTPLLRPATDADSDAAIGVLRRCWTAYAGVVVDIDGELPEMRRFAAFYREAGGDAWIAELDGAAVGCIAAAPDDEAGRWLLHKLNVLPDARRRGIGRGLVERAEDAARAAGAREMALWSDTRFTESHALYAALGYLREPETRELGDLSNTREIRFSKPL